MNEFIMLTQYYSGRTIMFRADSILCAARSIDDGKTLIADRESPNSEEEWVVSETPEEIYSQIYVEGRN